MGEQIVAFLNLEDFANDTSVTGSPYDVVRVQPIRRVTGGKPEHSLVQWIVLVTMQTEEGVAMVSILTGQRWEIFEKKDAKRYEENAEIAAFLIRNYLIDHDYFVASGIYSPQVVMDNIVGAGCNLWRFEEGRLIPVEENDE